MTATRLSISAFIFASALVVLCAAMSATTFAQTFTLLASFDESNGANPYGALVLGSDGNFYGTTQWGGANGQGAVFKVTPQGALTVLYNFCSLSGCADGSHPYAGLIPGPDGNFYGATFETVFRITPSGSLTTLYTFCQLPNCADGQNLYGPLVLGSDGNLYGTTFYGGTHSTYLCGGSCGTVFKLTPSGVLTTLHSFNGHDGKWPAAALVRGADGNFYGSASEGGPHGNGVIFKITPQGSFTLLHAFTGTDGSAPDAAMILAKDGNFYGTTAWGGTHSYGTVFKITSAGKLTTLRNFDLTNGGVPYAGLIQATDGNFYGTTLEGGTGDTAGNCPLFSNCGTIFGITPAGALTTLHNFCSQSSCPDGGSPYVNLVKGADGSLYGAATLGGNTTCSAYGTCGTIFKLSLH